MATKAAAVASAVTNSAANKNTDKNGTKKNGSQQNVRKPSQQSGKAASGSKTNLPGNSENSERKTEETTDFANGFKLWEFLDNYLNKQIKIFKLIKKKNGNFNEFYFVNQK